MTDTHEAPVTPDDDDAEVRPGPFWRHVLWAAAVTVTGTALGWASGRFRIGPEEYGLPSTAPGALWPYLAAWGAIGLVLAGILRYVAARVPVHSPEEAAIGVVLLGTRMSLGWRPEPLEVAGLALAGLLLVAVWCAVALRGAAAVRRAGVVGPE